MMVSFIRDTFSRSTVERRADDERSEPIDAASPSIERESVRQSQLTDSSPPILLPRTQHRDIPSRQPPPLVAALRVHLLLAQDRSYGGGTVVGLSQRKQPELAFRWIVKRRARGGDRRGSRDSACHSLSSRQPPFNRTREATSTHQSFKKYRYV